MAKKDAAELIAEAFARVASTPDGLDVLKVIFAYTGYSAPSLRMNPESGEINEKAMLYNISKRDVWIEVRKHIPPHQLAEIEIQGG